MKTFILSLIAFAALAFVPLTHAQKSSLTIGDGGTNIKLIQTGRATLASGTVTVANTKVTANTNIFVTRQTAAGTTGQSYDVTRSAGVSFTITAKAATDGTTTVATDTSVIAYWLVNP